MSKKASDILSRMKEVAARERVGAQEKPASTQAPPPNEHAARRKPVRITVDLDPELHRFLKVYAAKHGVTVSEVVRQLIEQLGGSGSSPT